MQKHHKFFLSGMLLGAIIIYVASKPKEEIVVVAKSTIPQVLTKTNNSTITGYTLPDKVDFAAEEVPLHRMDVMEKLDRELQVNAFWHSSTILLIKRANKWLPAIDSILVKNGIPSDFKYLAVIESGLQNVVSPKKAVGFWQFLHGTAREFGLEVTKEVDERYDPLKATEAACKYLHQSYKIFGSWTLVAASYNMGMNGINKALNKQGASSFFDLTVSEEPSRYVYRILALKEILEHTKSFGFDIPKAELYNLEPSQTVIIDKSIPDLVKYADARSITFQSIKRLNPWIRAHKLTLRSGNKYQLKLPI